MRTGTCCEDGILSSYRGEETRDYLNCAVVKERPLPTSCAQGTLCPYVYTYLHNTSICIYVHTWELGTERNEKLLNYMYMHRM